MACDPHELGAVAYTVYAEAVGGRAVNGDQLPTWDGLSSRIQNAWAAAADAVQIAAERGWTSQRAQDGDS
ncbi:hypothetical protein ACFUEN_28775 [Streptomyces griseorubiginosus]|uniref:hypothetical protein n=1 Tax=Streptomyces griseorubiginosus TaxID=67304 RepID=UPI00362C406C